MYAGTDEQFIYLMDVWVRERLDHSKEETIFLPETKDSRLVDDQQEKLGY
jgi:hypothetical protein